MSYAVMRVQKIKGNLSGIGIHTDRCNGGETVAPSNADIERVDHNLHWDKRGIAYTQNEWNKEVKGNGLNKRVNDHIKENYKLDRAIRKDAVKCLEYIFSSDNLKMNEIMEKPDIFENWIKDNRQFLADIYGEKNIVDMHLHLDETTPHLEVIVCPITSDGRLSAKEFINGKNSLIQHQTDYAERMEKYGMKRGEKGSTAKHQHQKNYTKTQSYEHNRS